MKIAVIDDERPARRELIHQILEHAPDAEIQEADSGASALALISTLPFDLLFLDISLNDMDGTTLAVAAKKLLPMAHIVFATAYSQYAVKAFELGVNNYLLKPFDPDRVKRVLDKCRAGLEAAVTQAPPTGRLAINTNRKILFLDISQIVYVETSGRSCVIHTTDGDYTENQLLGEYEKRLSPCGFFRIHKSFLVNVSCISEMFPWAGGSLAVKMQGFEKEILPVGREKVKPLRQLVGL